MSLTRAALAQIERLQQRLRDRLNNVVARVVVSLVNDANAVQALQIGVLSGETLDSVEHLIPYGLISVPRAGSQGVGLFVGGDRGNAVVVAVDDPSARPTGGDPGDTGLYHFAGAVIRLAENGDVTISAKPGAKVYIDDGAGGTDALVKKSEFDGHSHGPGSYNAPGGGGPVTGTSGGAPSVTGTETLESK